jgi:hypothetical protein
MAIDATEVRVAGAGNVYVAPEGTTLPTTSTSVLSAAWTDLGYCTSDGVTFTQGRETTDLDAWQGTKIRVLTDKEPTKVAFTLMQSNADVLGVAFGGGTLTEVSAGEYSFEPPALGENLVRALVIDFVDGDITYRYAISRAQIQGEVQVQLQRSGAVTYPLEFGVLDSDPKYLILSNDPAMEPAAS